MKTRDRYGGGKVSRGFSRPRWRQVFGGWRPLPKTLRTVLQAVLMGLRGAESPMAAVMPVLSPAEEPTGAFAVTSEPSPKTRPQRPPRLPTNRFTVAGDRYQPYCSPQTGVPVWWQGSYRRYGKRLFDIVFALTALVLFLPLYVAIALLIYVSSPGPVLYVQTRVGQGGRRFRCMKFRTMVVGADKMLAELLENCPQCRAEFDQTYKLKQDPRITAIGKWLRLTSLDEFPQFWNVLVGDMSVVGPRPLVPEELPKYGDAIHEVLSVRPGITGLWQVSGRNDIPYPRRVQMDARYARHFTFAWDVRIALKTVGVVLFPRNNGAY